MVLALETREAQRLWLPDLASPALPSALGAAFTLQDAPGPIASPPGGLAQAELGDEVLGCTRRNPKLRRDHASRDNRPGQYVVEESRQF